MPRTKGSKNRPKTNTTRDYASQIIEKQVSRDGKNENFVSH